MKHKLIASTGLLFFVFTLGLALRLVGLNWDQGQHLHPDERYLTMVANDIRWPIVKLDTPIDADLFEKLSIKAREFYQSFQLYLSPQSPLSPYNYNNFKSFLYGTFPVFWVKAWATLVGWDDYGHLVIVGRFWSAIFSAATVFLVYLLTKRVCKGATLYKVAPSVGLLTAFFTATSVTLIQNAHFFTLESFLVTFGLLVIYFSYRIWEFGEFRDFVLAGVSLGFALACKISAIFLGGVIGLAILFRVIREIRKQGVFLQIQHFRFINLAKNRNLFFLLISSTILLLVSYLTFRLLQPYAFANLNFFDLTLQPNFLANLKQQQAAIRGDFLYPPAYQWLLSTPFWPPLKNLVIWALGPALGASGVLGVLLMIYEMIFKKKLHYSLILSYILFIFFYVGGQFVNSIRYLITIAPLLNIAAAYFWVKIAQKPTGDKIIRFLPSVGVFWVIMLALFWALAFTGIYTRETTRITASKWIYQNIPADATLANEHWDDPLPLALPAEEFPISNFQFPKYAGVMLPVYNEDNPQKLTDLYEGLSKADYVILSSARASGSIGKLPEQFPIMSKYYQFLDSGKLGFDKVAEITSYPQLFGIIINDSSAEETFWVYDHPGVKIYRKTRELSRGEFFSLFP